MQHVDIPSLSPVAQATNTHFHFSRSVGPRVQYVSSLLKVTCRTPATRPTFYHTQRGRSRCRSHELEEFFSFQQVIFDAQKCLLTKIASNPFENEYLGKKPKPNSLELDEIVVRNSSVRPMTSASTESTCACCTTGTMDC